MSVLRGYAETVSQPTLPFDAPFDTPGRAARYDEMVDAGGDFRPGWKAMATQALSLMPEDLHRVTGEITRFLADDGVTYARPEHGPQPWQLDPIPLVIDAPTWARLEIGLAQRAELLNAILVDLYGPRTLLSSGIVPAAAIFGHSGFARPVARPSAFNTHPLMLSAADLGRDADGEWHVLADRVQAPSGLGFAMENRRVISQVMPDLFQEGDLHRMEPYFSALRATLISSAAEESVPLESLSSHPVRTPRPRSTRPSSPMRSASSWCRAATSSSTRAMCGSNPPAGPSPRRSIAST